jgi:hypothetical protein
MLLGKEVVISLQIEIIVNTCCLNTILECIVDMLIFIILVIITLYYEYRKTVEDLGAADGCVFRLMTWRKILSRGFSFGS